jgi:hypothetical protein
MLPLFTSSIRDARSVMTFGGAFCCAPAVMLDKQRAKLRKTTQIRDFEAIPPAFAGAIDPPVRVLHNLNFSGPVRNYAREM